MEKYRKIGDVLNRVMKPSCEKYGFITYRIVAHWEKIVGSKMAALSFPLQISFEPHKSSEGLLIIGVTNPGFALELQASEYAILSKLATYFGYKAISRIRIKIAKKIETTEHKRHDIVLTLSTQNEATKQQIERSESTALNNLINTVLDEDLAHELNELKNSLFVTQI